jgi:hypothetical protein
MQQPPHQSDDEIRADLERLSSASLHRVAQTMRDMCRRDPEIEPAVTSFLLKILEILDERGDT